jgi:phosphatidylglycerol:prolipoprotein diacylglycerol transferase
MFSSILALLLCVILLLLRRLRFYQKRDGLVLASFMIFYSAGRFMIEFVRNDEASFFGTGLTVSQNVSVLFGLAGLALFVSLCRKKNQ